MRGATGVSHRGTPDRFRLGALTVTTRPPPVATGGKKESGGEVRVELDLDRHARALVPAGLRPANAAVPPNPHFHLAWVAEVSPPVLALGPTHLDRHAVPVLAVPHREREPATAATPRDCDQRQATAQERMQGRTEHGPYDRVRCAVQDRKRRVIPRHGGDGIAVNLPAREAPGGERSRC
jgi:hypothetical protein